MMRRGWIVATAIAALAAGASLAFHPAPKLIWNASASVPIGLYAVRAAGVLRAGELVIIEPPRALAEYLSQRRYLPLGAPLLKHILALPGQRVCRTALAISIDGAVMGRALAHDRFGRALPVWRGCLRIRAGQVFVMNRRPPDSLDGRYFGALPATTIVGRADPLWIPGTHR
ncbi:MAG: S26 family signal peptidase [Caulobacteraceae bacterium]